MGILGLRIAGGGGFTAPVGSIRSIRPGKKQGHAVVDILWGRKHGRKADVGKVNRITVIGDWKKLTKRWKALREAG